MQEFPYIWMNGEFIDWKDANVHVLSHGLHYGRGVFEGLRAYDGPGGPHLFRLQEHMARLHKSAAIYQLPIPFDVETLSQASIELCQKNGLKDAYLRPLAFSGYDTLGVHPANCPTEVVIASMAWGAYLGEEAMTKGTRIMISGWRKFHPSSMPTNAKACGQYLNSTLAVMEAKSRGYDEALLLDMHGNIAEGSGENLFIYNGKNWVTNGNDASILFGITRESVVQILEDEGETVEFRHMSVGELLAAEEAFFVGSAAEVTPIREVNDRPIGKGVAGEKTLHIQKIYLDICKGVNEKYKHWLTPV